METVIIGFIVVLNVIAIVSLYRTLNGIEIKNRLAIMGICLIVVYVVLFVLYALSSIGIDDVVATSSRQIVLFTFLPINIICIICPFVLQITKFRDQTISEEKFKKRLVMCLVFSIVIIIIDFMYMRSVQTGIMVYKGESNE